MKEKSLSFKKYFEIVNPQYTTLQIIPHSSIRNYNSSNIAKMISSLYKVVNKRIHKEEKKYFIETKCKCSYVIDIHKTDVKFYFIVPQQYTHIAKNKIAEIWDKATIEECATIEKYTHENVHTYQLNYTKLDAFSLAVDKKSNNPLNSILNVVDVMEGEDRITVAYNFMPTSQYGWNVNCEKAQKKFKDNLPVAKEMNGSSIMKFTFFTLIDFVDGVLGGLFGDNKDIKDLNLVADLSKALRSNEKQLSNNTKNKKHDIVIDTQFAVLSGSDNKTRANNNAISVCQAFQDIEEDNSLEYQKVFSKGFDFYSSKFKGFLTNKVSTEECQNFIQMPARELLEKHKISHVNITETNVPKQLQTGVMCLGNSTCKGSTQKAYVSTDKSFKYLTLCLIGPTRAGKTTLISNLCNDSSRGGETNIIFDWCGNCDLSDDVIKSLAKAGIKVLVIDGSNMDSLQGLGYNELSSSGKDAFGSYKSAKQQATQLSVLINASQGGDEDLRARMERYLSAASIVVFLQNGSIRDVFQLLQQHELRHKYIKGVPTNQKENTAEYIAYLKELDKVDKEGVVVGTNISAVQGILNRVNKLKENPYMEMMLKKDCSNNFNLVEEIQKAQLICIKMPETMFSTEQEKDTYATYWLTKLWGALQQRKWKLPNEKDRIKVNMYFDELYQVESCQEFLRSKLSQIAKFGAKPIISCHYLGQIPGIRNELKSANTSYVLISGSDKDNYKELKDELQPYTLEDLINLERFRAINLIKYEEGWARFTTALPKPL